MAWFYLVLAGLMEVGWPIGFKLAWSENGFQWKPAALGVLSMVASLGLMTLATAQKTIAMGTIYAVWTGIGSAGAVIVGILFFQESASFMRLGCVTLIIFGIVGLKIAESR